MYVSLVVKVAVQVVTITDYSYSMSCVRANYVHNYILLSKLVN